MKVYILSFLFLFATSFSCSILANDQMNQIELKATDQLETQKSNALKLKPEDKNGVHQEAVKSNSPYYKFNNEHQNTTDKKTVKEGQRYNMIKTFYGNF
jgi:hypothetical protein